MYLSLIFFPFLWVSFLRLALGWDREDDVVVKQFFVTAELILCQRGEGLATQASHEKCPADDVIRDAVFVQKRTVIRQVKQLALLVCDDRYLFLVRINRFVCPPTISRMACRPSISRT